MLNAAVTSASIRCNASRTAFRQHSPARRPRPRPRRAAPVPTRAFGHPACFHITILVIHPCRFRRWPTAARCFQLVPLSSPVAGAWPRRDLSRFPRPDQGPAAALPTACFRLWGRRRVLRRLCRRIQGRSACGPVAHRQRPVGVFLGRSRICDARSVRAHSPVLRHRHPIRLFHLSPRLLFTAARTTCRWGTARKVRFYVTFRAITCAFARSMLTLRPATPTAPAVNPSPCAAARGSGSGRTRSPRRHRA